MARLIKWLLILIVIAAALYYWISSEQEMPTKVQAAGSYANLLAAVEAETTAYTKYDAYAAVAEEEGYDQAARLFKAAAAAERIHAGLAMELVQALDPEAAAPEIELTATGATPANLEDARDGELYEANEMYPPFVEQAVSDEFPQAEKVFTRAMKTEGAHAELYQEMILYLSVAEGQSYHLCPVCGKIEESRAPMVCLICGTWGTKFVEY